ncbi:MAG: hypothetical protein ACLP8A_05935 [Methylovirgula sp.]
MRHVSFIFSRIAMAAAIAGAPMFASKALADDPATTADLRCLVVGLRFAGSPTENLKQAGLIETLYYLGRLDSRIPNLDLEGQVGTLLTKMNEQDFKTEAQRCGLLLSQRGQALQTMGKDLSAKGADKK